VLEKSACCAANGKLKGNLPAKGLIGEIPGNCDAPKELLVCANTGNPKKVAKRDVSLFARPPLPIVSTTVEEPVNCSLLGPLPSDVSIPTFVPTWVRQADQGSKGKVPKNTPPVGPPMIPVKLGSKTVRAILDTGCGKTLVTTGLMAKIAGNDWESKLKPSKVKLNSASGHRLQVLGRVDMNLTIGSVMFPTSVQVVREATAEFILGNDVIYDRVTIHEGKMASIQCRPNLTRDLIPIEYNLPACKALVVETVSIPPESYKLVKCTLHPVQTADSAYYIGHSMYLTERIPDADQVNEYKVSDSISKIGTDSLVEVLVNNLSSDVVEIDSLSQIATAEVILDYDNGTNMFLVTGPPVETCHIQTSGANNIADDESTDSSQIIPCQSCYFLTRDEHELRDIVEGSPSGDPPLPPGLEIPRDEPYDLSFSDVGLKLPTEDREQLLTILRNNIAAFAKSELDFGKTKMLSHAIDTGDAKPVRQPYRPCPKQYENFVREVISGLYAKGIIEPANGPWATNIVVATRPRSDKLRMCVDLRACNAATKHRASWPINVVV
jgi:hypothetical protein